MLVVLFRAILLFLTAVLLVRLMGKRQIGQLQPFELVIAIMIADLAAGPMENLSSPLLYGIVPMVALLMLHSLLSLASLKSLRLRKLISGKASVLVRGGVFQEKEMQRICYDLSELLAEMREAGFLNPADVGTAILETNGKMSVFAGDGQGIPLALVLDGSVQVQALERGGLSEAWLGRQLEKAGFSAAQDVFLASLDTRGTLLCQGRGERPRITKFAVMEPNEVTWQ